VTEVNASLDEALDLNYRQTMAPSIERPKNPPTRRDRRPEGS